MSECPGNRKVFVIKRVEWLHIILCVKGVLPSPDYMTRCHNRMRQKYGEPVYILITQKADLAHYPNGAWFDAYVNSPMQIVGVDEETLPKLYILPDGTSIPVSCAELLNWSPSEDQATEIAALVDEMFHKKSQCGQDKIMKVLRLAFPDLPDDAELVISQSSPFLIADGSMVWLEGYRYLIDKYVVEFVAGVHKVKTGKFCVVALDNGGGSCILLTKT